MEKVAISRPRSSENCNDGEKPRGDSRQKIRYWLAAQYYVIV